jgi:hypothetical protein
MIATNAPLVLEQMASDRQHHRQAAARSYRLSRLARGRSAGGAPAVGRPARIAPRDAAAAATRTAARASLPASGRGVLAGKGRLERYASLL